MIVSINYQLVCLLFFLGAPGGGQKHVFPHHGDRSVWKISLQNKWKTQLKKDTKFYWLWMFTKPLQSDQWHENLSVVFVTWLYWVLTIVFLEHIHFVEKRFKNRDRTDRETFLNISLVLRTLSHAEHLWVNHVLWSNLFTTIISTYLIKSWGNIHIDAF